MFLEALSPKRDCAGEGGEREGQNGDILPPCFVLIFCLFAGFVSAQTSPSANEPAEDGQWPMFGKNYANTRYSGLDQINTENVKNLKVAWAFSTAVNRGQEAAPLVIGSTMYVAPPFPTPPYPLA